MLHTLVKLGLVVLEKDMFTEDARQTTHYDVRQPMAIAIDHLSDGVRVNELIFFIHVQNNCFSYSIYVIFDYCLIILAMFIFFNFKRDIISANILLRTCGFNSDGHFMKRIL